VKALLDDLLYSSVEGRSEGGVLMAVLDSLREEGERGGLTSGTCGAERGERGKERGERAGFSCRLLPLAQERRRERGGEREASGPAGWARLATDLGQHAKEGVAAGLGSEREKGKGKQVWPALALGQKREGGREGKRNPLFVFSNLFQI
jgi:hypothetical protein